MSVDKPALHRLIPKCSKNAFNLIKKMLCLNPKNRPTLKQISKDIFFSQKTPDTSKSVSSNDSLDNAVLSNELKLKLDLKNIDKTQHVLGENNIMGKNKERLVLAKNVIKNRLISKIGQLNQLDLSSVEETDRESNHFVTQSIHARVPSSKHTRESSQQARSNTILSKYIRQESGHGMRKYASYKNLHKSPIASKFNKYDAEHNFDSQDGSVSNHAFNNPPTSERQKSDPVGYYDSSTDEIDILRKQMEIRPSNSLPVSMKNIAPITSRYSSRGSPGLESNPATKNYIDKYFIDFNGKSLLSTLSSSNDVFTNISLSRKSNDFKRSLVSGSKTNRGIMAGNQILFGSSGRDASSHELNSGYNSGRQSSLDTRQSGKSTYH